MATSDQAELLAQIGAATPMGMLLRQYWVPAIRSERLEAGGAPVALRIFGENVVAFRTHDGRVGLFDERCPHRGVSLLLARNEDNALRCIFHGWKIDVSGKLVEIPTEPRDRCAAFAESVKFGRYKTHEASGIVWAWLGSGEAPPFPTFAFTGLPETHVIHFVGLLDCHWLQALEMLLDPVHIGILHQAHLSRSQLYVRRPDGRDIRLPITMTDPPPHIEIEHTAYGFRGAALRELEDGTRYVRVTEWVMPFYAFLAARRGETQSLYIAIPADAEHTNFWYVGWNAGRPLNAQTLKANALGGSNPNNIVHGLGSREDLWRQDRSAMQRGHFTGLKTDMHEEVIIPQAQGRLQEFSRQNLGWSDRMVIAARERLERSALQLQQHGQATAPPTNDLGTINPIAGFCERDARWQDLKP
jgi:phenylpropionate dioxygenase-like ring-hydroxylating dioxygenase large terminal subunit